MQIETEFLKIISVRYSKAFEHISCSIKQLDDRQFWHRPSPESNSVCIITKHLIGNLNQWVCSAIGGNTYQRNRRQEFEDTRDLTKDDVLGNMSVLDKNIRNIISGLSPESLLASRRIQGFDETVMSALIAALTHLELHTGQVVYIVKLILKEKYQEFWKPGTIEQGK
jgi:hypothetical protein